MADFTAASVGTTAAFGTGSVTTDEVFSLKSDSLIDVDVVPSGSFLLPFKAGDASGIAEAVADLIGDMSTSHSRRRTL